MHPCAVAEDWSPQHKPDCSARALCSRHSQGMPCSSSRWATRRHPSNISFIQRSWGQKMFPVPVSETLSKPPCSACWGGSGEVVGGSAGEREWGFALVTVHHLLSTVCLLSSLLRYGDRWSHAIWGQLWWGVGGARCFYGQAIFRITYLLLWDFLGATFN